MATFAFGDWQLTDTDLRASGTGPKGIAVVGRGMPEGGKPRVTLIPTSGLEDFASV
jgi:hypothetical protein